MKIFLSFLQSSHNHPIPAYSFWEYYIKKGIEESGHEWLECKDVDWAYGLVSQSKSSLTSWKTVVWEKTIKFIHANPPDLFLSYLYPHQVDESAIKEIQKKGIPCVNFFCDNVREFKKIPTEYSVFDINWVPEYKAIKMYRQAGYSYINLPMPMWVAPQHRTILQNENNRVSFIGSHDIQRQLLFEDVLNKSPELPLDIYGEGWKTKEKNKKQNTSYTLGDKLSFQYKFLKNQGSYAYLRKIQQRKYKPAFTGTLISHIKDKPDFENYINLSKQSSITLGVNRYPSFLYPINKPGSYSRLRDIEAPMLGACYLTEWTEGLDQLYDLEKEIRTYKTSSELIEVAKQMFSDKNLRLQLRVNCQKRALENHSIANSLKMIFIKLEG